MQFTDQTPIYIQIADTFCENILAGKWAANDRIPSVREVAVAMEVNPNTAMRSYTFLQERDIIANKRGIGYFVAEGGRRRALEYLRQDFLRRTVPDFFKKLYLLEIPYGDLEEYYNQNQQPNQQ